MLTNGSIKYQAHHRNRSEFLRIGGRSDEKLGRAGCLSLSLGLLDSSLVGFSKRHDETLEILDDRGV